MLGLEQTMVHPEPKGWYGVASLDAVKCFDLLPYPDVIRCSQMLAIPVHLLGLLATF